MSSFMKTSPLSSSSYGMYGSASINPYASYFGPQQHSASASSATSAAAVTSPYQGQGSGVGGYYMASSPPSSSFMSPSSPLPFNPHSFGAATSPFSTSGQHLGSSVGGGQHFVPLPAQTRIIGGVNNTGGQPSSSFHQSPPRYFSSYNQQSTPSRIEDFSSEPMHYSPIHVNPNQQGYGHSIGLHTSSPPNAVLLPSYFLGLDEANHHHSYHQSGALPLPSSPGGVNQSGSSGVLGPSSFMNPQGKSGYRKVLFFEPPGFTDPETDGKTDDREGANKVKGPPIYGFGSSEKTTTKDFIESPWMKDSYNATSFTESGSQVKSPPQPPPSTSTTASSAWVTVFGFPAGASSFILKNFSTFGKIMEVKSTHGSNWLHIRYSNKIEARLALSKNGKVLGGSIMVGVVNSDPKVVQEAHSAGGENTDGNSSHSTPAPIPSPSTSVHERHSDSDAIKSRIRPLATGSLPHQQPMVSKTTPRSMTQMPSLAREAIEVERRSGSGSGLLPSASNGVLTKAMEFMFGW